MKPESGIAIPTALRLPLALEQRRGCSPPLFEASSFLSAPEAEPEAVEEEDARFFF